MSVEEAKLPFEVKNNLVSAPLKNKLEICNVHGNLICIINDKEMIKDLNLQAGFYLLREKDLTGKIIKSSKLIF